ncbi:MAG: indole-3-glycerol phosphate synthase TrpC [Pyrinomonadaceae bacterium]
MNILSEIIVRKRQRLEVAKLNMPEQQLRLQAEEVQRSLPSHSLSQAIAVNDGLNIIAEFKRRSPSRGFIREGAAATEIARSYEIGGAKAVSVLTEEDYFAGSLADLQEIRAAVGLPLLRKDFIVDPYQIYEAAAAGANAILLIVAALDDHDLLQLREIAENAVGLDALVEVHTREELKRAEDSGATLVGINNRDLHTFEVSIDTSFRLAAIAPRNAILVSESGLYQTSDLEALRDAGYNGFLIGESLMRSEKPNEALQALRGSGK